MNVSLLLFLSCGIIEKKFNVEKIYFWKVVLHDGEGTAVEQLERLMTRVARVRCCQEAERDLSQEGQAINLKACPPIT